METSVIETTKKTSSETGEDGVFISPNLVPLVAHELKNPLTSVRGYTELLLSEAVGPVTPEQRKFLLTILSNVQRMSIMISDLADTAKMESGHLSLDIQPVDLNGIVEEVRYSSQPLIEEKNLNFQVELPVGGIKVLADNTRLAQVLTNLVSNAIKYTPEKGTITIGAQPEGKNPSGKMLQIWVKDSGIGISAEDQKKIFQKYFRTEDERTREIPGTGLGLYITRLLVHLHHGKIWIESEPGKGSTFHFTIPLA